MREGKMCLKLLQELLNKVKKENKKCRKNREEAGGDNKRQNKVEVKGMVSEEVFQNMTVGSYLL